MRLASIKPLLTAAVTAISIVTACPSIAMASTSPHFVGDLTAKFDPDGVHMTLIHDFAFVGPDGQIWSAPAGTTTNGASIPQVLWSFGLSPFTGKYRGPAVIHDYYCDHESRPWQAVHRMFYDAMIAAGVDSGKAAFLYAGVLLGGPKWDLQTIHNEELAEQVAIGNYLRTHPQAGGPHEGLGDSREKKVAQLVADKKAKIVGRAFSVVKGRSNLKPDPVLVVAIPRDPSVKDSKAVARYANEIANGKDISPENIEYEASVMTNIHPELNPDWTARPALEESPGFVDLSPIKADEKLPQ